MVEPASKKSKNDFKLKIGKKIESEQQLIKLPNQEDSPMNIEKQSEMIVEIGQKQTSRNIFLEDFYILGAKEVNNSVWIYGKHNNKKIDIKVLDFCKTLYIELMDEDINLESLNEKFLNIKKKIKSIGDIACQKIVAQQIFREEQFTGKMFKLQIKGSYDWNNIEKRNQIVNIFRNERLMLYGHTVSLLEDFLLEKGIKGSCWLQIEDKISEFSPCIQAEKIKVKELISNQSLQTPQLVVILFTYSFQQQNLDYIIFNKATLNSQCQFESQSIQDHTVIYREHSQQIQTKQNGVKCVNTLSMLDRFKAEFKKADILIGYDLEPLKQIWRQNRKDEFWNLDILLLDLYHSAQGLINLKDYSLNTLTNQILKKQRTEVDNIQEQLVLDKNLILDLVQQMQIIPLTKQISNITGATWQTSLSGQRAKCNEMFLMHQFQSHDLIVPDMSNQKKQGFVGGKVLDPQKKFYTNPVLLLDFNSLYPSIIIEYGLCFSSIYQDSQSTKILPTLIQNLVEERRQVKQEISKTNNEMKKSQLEIQQKALKLTANSMYGVLGFDKCRFYCPQLAALITQNGRDILLATKSIIESQGLQVIYGDTDSVMIHCNIKDIQKCWTIAREIASKINKQYKFLTIEVECIFIKFLLLGKKKYAAMRQDGKIEIKGLDMVRRDWSNLCKITCQKVLDIIFQQENESIAGDEIYQLLTQIRENVLNGQVPIEDFQICQKLTKHPKEYKNENAHPHVQIAKRMLASQKLSIQQLINHYIDYIICDIPSHKNNLSEKARHITEMQAEGLQPDLKWYLQNQIYNPVSRLCSSICDKQQLAVALQIKIHQQIVNNSEENQITVPCLFCNNPFDNLQNQIENQEILCMSCQQKNHIKALMNRAHVQIMELQKQVNSQGYCEKCGKYFLGVQYVCEVCQSKPFSTRDFIFLLLKIKQFFIVLGQQNEIVQKIDRIVEKEAMYTTAEFQSNKIYSHLESKCVKFFID